MHFKNKYFFGVQFFTHFNNANIILYTKIMYEIRDAFNWNIIEPRTRKLKLKENNLKYSTFPSASVVSYCRYFV